MLFQPRLFPRCAWVACRFGAGMLAVSILLGSTAAAANSVATVVHAKTLNGYKRAKQKDGSFRPEYYVLGDGGILAEGPRDPAQQKTSFMTIARGLEKLLAQHNYLMADDAASAELLLVVHWGRTITFSDATYGIQMASAGQARATMLDARADRLRLLGSRSDADQANASQRKEVYAAAAEEFDQQMVLLRMENLQRDQINERNALLLGYKEEMDGSDDIRRSAMKMNLFDDLRTEIEQERYFVVITAYKLPLPTDQKKQKILWSTRVSIRAQGNNFQERLDQMIASATRYAGRDSGRLIRQFEGTVEFGELTVVGVEEPAEDSAPPAESEQGKPK